jgi:hypothetical protein
VVDFARGAGQHDPRTARGASFLQHLAADGDRQLGFHRLLE